MEIERKFKVKYLPDLSDCKKSEIIQGYLSYEPEIRIRRKGNKYFITKKSNGTLEREELETEINADTFNILSDLIQDNIISKTRYEKIIADDLIAEIDIYHGINEGLIVVEVEFKSLEESLIFQAPDWFGEEITDDSSYKNKNLAKN